MVLSILLQTWFYNQSTFERKFFCSHLWVNNIFVLQSESSTVKIFIQSDLIKKKYFYPIRSR